jgi:hypothetical protein
MRRSQSANALRRCSGDGISAQTIPVGTANITDHYGATIKNDSSEQKTVARSLRNGPPLNQRNFFGGAWLSFRY